MTTSAQTESQRSRVSKAFDLMDVNGNGELGIDDIEALAEQLVGRFGFAPGSPQHTDFRQAGTVLWQGLLQGTGLTGSDRISRKEYVDFYAEADPETVQQALAPLADLLFGLFDGDGDGKVSRSEFERYHRAWGVSDDRIQGTFQQLNTDGSGELSQQQLRQYLGGFIFGDFG